MYRLVQIQSFWVDRKGGINSNIALTWNRSRRYHSISSLKHNSFRTVWISDSWIIQSLISLLYSSPCFQIELDVLANRFSTVLFFLRWHFKIKKRRIPTEPCFFLILMPSALRINLRPWEKAWGDSTHEWKKSSTKYPECKF